MSNQTSSAPLIVVLGATGNQGGSVIENLLKQGNKWRIRGLCRNTEADRAKELSRKGVEMYKCDISDKNQVLQAFKGAYGVFALTNFWQSEIVKQPDVEFNQGKNVVDAALQNNVKHFVWSSLDDVKKICGLDVPHFTNKNRVEQYAREKNLPYMTFVYPSSFFENLFQFFQISDDKSQGRLTYGVDENVKLPMFSIWDIGIIVADIFNRPDEYNRKKILGASELLTMPEVAQIMSQALGVKTTYRKLSFDMMKREMNEEMAEMTKYFNTKKYYYSDNQEEAFRETKKKFPQMIGLHQWIVQNKNKFMNAPSFKSSA